MKLTRERIVEIIFNLEYPTGHSGPGMDEYIKKEMGKTADAILAEMEEPLAVLADRKGYWVEIRNFNKEYGWGIYIHQQVPRGPFQTQDIEKDLLSDKNYYDYAEGEAEARDYLNGLPDKSNGK